MSMSKSSQKKSVVLWHLSGCIATFYEYKDQEKKIPVDTVCFSSKAYLGYKQVDILKIATPAVPYLNSLCSLQLQNNKLKSLPIEIWHLSNLQELNLGYNQLEEIPKEIGLLVHLKEVYIHNNHIKEIPCQIGKLKQLTTLDITDNEIMELPAEILKLENIQNLWMDGNQFKIKDRGNRFISLKNICIQNIGLICLNDEISRKVIEEEPMFQQQNNLLLLDKLLLPNCFHCQSPLFHSNLEYINLIHGIPYLFKLCNQNCFIQIKK